MTATELGMLLTGMAITLILGYIMYRFLKEFFSAIRDTVNANRAYEHWERVQEYSLWTGSPSFRLWSLERRKYLWSCYVHQVQMMQNYIDNIEDGRFRDQVMLELYTA